MVKPSKPLNEDAEQSRRFIETAKEMEAAGELNPTEGAEAFDRLLKRAAPSKARKVSQSDTG